MKWAILVTAVVTMAGLAHAEAPIQSRAAGDGAAIQLKAQPTTLKQVQGALSRLRAAPRSGHSFVGIGGVCHVDSRVAVSVKVYINGQFVGIMGPFGDLYPFVADFPGQITSLYAVSVDGRYSWSRNVGGAFGNYHWVLVP